MQDSTHKSNHMSQAPGSSRPSVPQQARPRTASAANRAAHAPAQRSAAKGAPASRARAQRRSGMRTKGVSGRTAQLTMQTRAGRSAARRAPQSSIKGGHIAIAGILFALIVVLVVFVVHSCGAAPDSKASVIPGQTVQITVAEGSGASTIASSLLDAGVISDTQGFYEELARQDVESKLKSGTYSFVTGEDISEVVAQLAEGPNTTTGKLTVPEGLTVSALAQQVQSSLGISADDFLAQAKASNYVSDYPFLANVQNDSLEGYLFPKTYDFSGETPTADTVIRAMLDQYKAEIAKVDFASGEALIQSRYGITMSDYQIVTMASIIEREAATDEDRPKVASVFYNRLKLGMALQSDATMSYVTGGDVSADDLKKESPYNTYLNTGLTPTPICSPSLASLEAALNPADTNYLYFFLLENGKVSIHSFSETYEQHQQAIADAQKQQAQAQTEATE